MKDLEEIKVIIGEAFKYKDGSNGLPLQFQNQMFRKNFLDEPEKTIILNQKEQKLSCHVILYEKRINDIVKEINSAPMSKERFLATVHLLINDPAMGKEILGYELKDDLKYAFFVKRSGKIYLNLLEKKGCRWDLYANEAESYIFLELGSAVLFFKD